VGKWFSKFARGITENNLWLLLCLLCLAGQGQARCAPDRVNLKWEGGTVSFATEVRDTADERAQGLMHRESMPRFSSMLFVYDAPGPASFWMRNTLIPLDMLFFDQTGTLVKLHPDAIPLDETAIFGGNNIKFVLEVNAGLGAQLRIGAGAQLQHPSIGDTVASWPCG